MAADAERVELRRQLEEFARARDPLLRNEIAQSQLGLAHFLARRFAHRGETLDDLVQVASLALLKAVDGFDPSRGLEFSTFAAPTIIGELKRHLRDKTWSVRVPRRLQELHLQIKPIVDELTQELGRSPTIPEIAEAAEVSEDDVLEAMEAGLAYRSSSVDAPVRDGEDGDTLGSQLGVDDEGMDQVDRRLVLSPLLATLPKREQLILQLRFFEEKTQSEIAARLGVSQMHVSRLLARSLAELAERAAPSSPRRATGL